jgi:hypothetical protein
MKKVPGPWVRLAHDMYRNPKVMVLMHRQQHRSVAVYCCGLAWCGDHRQDGFIPAFALAQIHGRASDAAHLCEVGLWLPVDGGWVVNDWDAWQDTNDIRQARTERMRGLANIRHHGHPDGHGPGDEVVPMDAWRNA